MMSTYQPYITGRWTQDMWEANRDALRDLYAHAQECEDGEVVDVVGPELVHVHRMVEAGRDLQDAADVDPVGDSQ